MGRLRRKLPPGAEATTRSCLIALGIRGADLDELCQAVFAVAARHDLEPPKAWLHETARKQAANFCRLYRHKFEVLDPDAGEDVGVELAEPELRLDVHRALANLAPEDAELLVRHKLGGEAVRALARELGVSRSRMHKRLRCALARFVEALGA